MNPDVRIVIEDARSLGWDLLHDPAGPPVDSGPLTKGVAESVRAETAGSSIRTARFQLALLEIIERYADEADTTVWAWRGALSNPAVVLAARTSPSRHGARESLTALLHTSEPSTKVVEDPGYAVAGAELVLRGRYDRPGRKAFGFLTLNQGARGSAWAFRAGGVDVSVTLPEIELEHADSAVLAADRAVAAMRVEPLAP